MTLRDVGPLIAFVAGWLWAIVAGIFSACPATAWLFKRWFHIELSGRAQVIAAASFFVAGRIAL